MIFPFLLLLLNNLFFIIPGTSCWEVQLDGPLVYSDDAKWELNMLNKLKFDFPNTSFFYGFSQAGNEQKPWSIEGPSKTHNVPIQFNSSYENGTVACHYWVGDKHDREKGDWELEHGYVFNEELAEPECLYSFYKIAMDRGEYDLLRYCAKGYFYRGFNYTDIAARLYREDWVLNLMEGSVKCNVSANPQRNNDLIAVGYTLQMVQWCQEIYGKTDESKPGKGIWNSDPIKLCQFSDDDHEGKFMLAGILGSLNYKGKKCQGNKNNDYIFALRVGHHCTPAKEYQELEFDLTFNPKNISRPDRGVQEDQGVEILLNEGFLKFAGNSLLCDKRINASECAEKLAALKKAGKLRQNMQMPPSASAVALMAEADDENNNTGSTGTRSQLYSMAKSVNLLNGTDENELPLLSGNFSSSFGNDIDNSTDENNDSEIGSAVNGTTTNSSIANKNSIGNPPDEVQSLLLNNEKAVKKETINNNHHKQQQQQPQ